MLDVRGQTAVTVVGESLGAVADGAASSTLSARRRSGSRLRVADQKNCAFRHMAGGEMNRALALGRVGRAVALAVDDPTALGGSSAPNSALTPVRARRHEMISP